MYPGVELLDHTVVVFLVILRKLHTAGFNGGCTNLPLHLQYMKAPFLYILATIRNLTV